MRITLFCFALAAGALALLAQMPQFHRGMSYEEETPPILHRYALRRFDGVVMDDAGQPIPAVLLGLYSEAAPHQLLAVLASSADGKFDFGKQVPPGSYRLVVKYPGLCTANIPLQLAPKAPKVHFDVRMEYPGLQVCSYAQTH